MSEGVCDTLAGAGGCNGPDGNRLAARRRVCAWRRHGFTDVRGEYRTGAQGCAPSRRYLVLSPHARRDAGRTHFIFTPKTQMLTQRNSTPQPSRGRNVVAVVAAVIAPIAAMIAACSTDSVTSPTSAARVAATAVRPNAGPVASTAPTPPPPKPKAKPSPVDSAMRQSPAQLAAIAPTWHTQSSDIESGTDRPLNLACGFDGVYSVGQPIGPNGGVLRFGSSSLTIPKGALSSTVMISATVTLGQAVKVDFAPHGMQFAKAVTIVTDYSGCTMPSTGAINVYYTDASGGITQSMPSSNDAAHGVVTSLTDHFSGYAVAWGRSAY